MNEGWYYHPESGEYYEYLAYIDAHDRETIRVFNREDELLVMGNIQSSLDRKTYKATTDNYRKFIKLFFTKKMEF